MPLYYFPKFTAVTPDKPGKAYFRRRIRCRRTGSTLHLQRVVPLSGGGCRGYYFGPKAGIRAVDRNGVTRIVKNTRDRVWLA